MPKSSSSVSLHSIEMDQLLPDTGTPQQFPKAATDQRSQAVPPPAWTFIARWVGFMIFEAAYIALGAICLHSPVPLDVSTSWVLPAKSLFTVVLIAWQTVCGMLISALVTHIFSAEWHVQLRRTERIVPGKTDKVSTLTSDLYDQAQHFLSKNASRTFRISFLLSLIIMALRGIAPSAVGITIVPISNPLQVQIANLSAGSDIIQINDYVGYSRPLLIRRAAITAHMEQLENSTFKYKTPPNHIIPVPTIDEILAGKNTLPGPIKYRSDFAKFNFSCEWTLPIKSYELFNVSGKQWQIYDLLFAEPNLVRNYTAGVFPLTPVTYDGIPTEEQSATETTLSVYLFAGRNSTFPQSTGNLEGINLDTLPTVEAEDLLSRYRISAPLISLLVCDPHLELISGEITLQTDFSLEVTKTIDRPLGNMQQNLTNLMFTLGMIDVASFFQVNPKELILQQATLDWFMNDMSAKIFTSNPSFNSTPYVPPLPTDQISRNINKYFLSASKAFTDGYRYRPNLQGQNLVPIAFYSLTNVSGAVVSPTVSIATTGFVFYIACLLIGLVLFLTPLLYRGWKIEKKYPFTFDTLVRERHLKEE